MTRVLVAEPKAPIAAALRKFLEPHAEVQTAQYLDEAVQLVRAKPPEVLIAAVSGAFDGEVLCAQVRRLNAPVSVLLVYPPEVERPEERAHAALADGWLVMPLKRAMVLNAVQAVGQVRELRERIKALEAEVKALSSRPLPRVDVPRPKVALNRYDEAFFKKYLLLELKRARRYQYPSALFVCEPDGLAEVLARSKEPGTPKKTVIEEAASKLAELLRDIDVVLPFGEERLLAFLPHTPGKGALIVARRALERLATLSSAPGLTFSIGLAAFDPKASPKEKVNFGSLVREATSALRRARSLGGNAVESAFASQGPKKDRISLA